MKSEDPFPQLALIEERVRRGLFPVEHLAPRQVEEVFHPFPPGTDYLPAPFFVLACRSRGVSSDAVTDFACALESFALALRMLVALTSREGVQAFPRSDGEHREGMALLLADGLIVTANRFLADLYPTDLKRLVPLLGSRPREWIGQIESMTDEREGIAVIQRSLSAAAVQAVREVVRDADESTELIERVMKETDRLLSEYRTAEGGAERRSVVEALDEFRGSVGDLGGGARPLAYYISLVLRPLSAISAP